MGAAAARTTSIGCSLRPPRSRANGGCLSEGFPAATHQQSGSGYFQKLHAAPENQSPHQDMDKMDLGGCRAGVAKRWRLRLDRLHRANLLAKVAVFAAAGFY